MWHLSAAVRYMWWTESTFTSTSWRCEVVCLQWMSKAFLYSSWSEISSTGSLRLQTVLLWSLWQIFQAQICLHEAFWAMSTETGVWSTAKIGFILSIETGLLMLVALRWCIHSSKIVVVVNISSTNRLVSGILSDVHINWCLIYWQDRLRLSVETGVDFRHRFFVPWCASGMKISGAVNKRVWKY